MRFLVSLFSLIVFNPLALASASPLDAIIPAVKAPLASKSLLLDIIDVEQNKLIAVGERGHILTSIDGLDWQQANVPVQSTLTSVFFINKRLGWAVGHNATILHSHDGGKNWQVQQYKPNLEKPLLDVVFKNPQEGVAVGAYGLMFRTNDGGKSWKSEFHREFLLADDVDYLTELKNEDEEAYLDEIAFILPHFNRLTKDDDTLFLLGETGLFAKSNDFGITWHLYEEVYQGSFFDSARTQEGNLLIAGLRGHVFRGVENDTCWTEIETKTTALLNDIVVSLDGRIFLLGNGGVLLESKDDGLTYQLHNQQDGKALIAGVWYKEQLVIASEVGIKIIRL